MTKSQQKINNELEKFRSENTLVAKRTEEDQKRVNVALSQMRENLEEKRIISPIFKEERKIL